MASIPLVFLGSILQFLLLGGEVAAGAMRDLHQECLRFLGTGACRPSAGPGHTSLPRGVGQLSHENSVVLGKLVQTYLYTSITGRVRLGKTFFVGGYKFTVLAVQFNGWSKKFDYVVKCLNANVGRTNGGLVLQDAPDTTFDHEGAKTSDASVCVETDVLCVKAGTFYAMQPWTTGFEGTPGMLFWGPKTFVEAEEKTAMSAKVLDEKELAAVQKTKDVAVSNTRQRLKSLVEGVIVEGDVKVFALYKESA